MRWNRITLLALAASLAAACDDGSAGALYAAEPSKNVCVVDADCGSAEVCFAGECVFQGNDVPPPAEPQRPDDLPAEVEERIAAVVRPAAGVEHVFVPRPNADAVARIHGETLAIDAIEVGDRPTVVRVAPGTERVVVLNQGSDEIALVDGDASPRFFPLGGHFNALNLTPDGRYAVCWFDLSRAEPDERVDTLQDLVVLDLDEGRHHAVTIGFRPRRVQFTADGSTALVVTDDGVSIVRPAELEATQIARTIPAAPNVYAENDRDILLTADGRWAVSHGPGEAGVTVVDLTEGVPRFVELPGVPTDLDLLPDGTAALVMLRGERRLALLVLERAAEGLAALQFVDFPEHVLGSAAVTDDLAVLYTTQQQTRPQITLLDLGTLELVHRPMRKAIAGVELAPDGQAAIVLHHAADGTADPSGDTAEFLARTHAYSLLDLRTVRVKLQATPATPRGLVFSPDRPEAFLLLRDDAGVAAVQHIDLAGFEVRTWALGTPPEVIGVLPELERAFVTQTHPEGRISFIHLGADTRLETVSGYALNGRID